MVGMLVICDCDCFKLETKWAKLIPPTPNTPAVTVPATMNPTSLLRSSCSALLRERELVPLRRTVVRAGSLWRADVLELADVVDHQANGSKPAMESDSPAGRTAGIVPVTRGGINCHLPEGFSASSNLLRGGGSVSCASCRNWPVREVEVSPTCSNTWRTRSKAFAISPAR